jgi:transposase
MKNNKILDFSNTHFFIGIDVHKKRWVVTIITIELFLKRFSIDAKPEELINYMRKNYPNGIYHSVYESGFCGFHIHDKLCEGGFHNMIVHAADVPSTGKEKSNKNDGVDSFKLARELSNGSLKGIFIPGKYHQTLRGLVRRREDLSKRQMVIKQKIKSFLNFTGISLPDELSHWSGKLIEYLKNINFDFAPDKENMSLMIEELIQIKRLISISLKSIRKEIKSKDEINKIIELLLTVPGVGFVTAITLYTELVDIDRFKKLDQLPSYIGLVPSIYSSGDYERSLGIANRHNSHLRNLIIEVAWKAVQVDPALTLAFQKLKERMPAQKAIIRIAKKLLLRIRHVWQTQTPYVMALVA